MIDRLVRLYIKLIDIESDYRRRLAEDVFILVLLFVVAIVFSGTVIMVVMLILMAIDFVIIYFDASALYRCIEYKKFVDKLLFRYVLEGGLRDKDLEALDMIDKFIITKSKVVERVKL